MLPASVIPTLLVSCIQEIPQSQLITEQEKSYIEDSLLTELANDGSHLEFTAKLQEFLYVNDGDCDRLLKADHLEIDHLNQELKSAISLLHISVCNNKDRYAHTLLEQGAHPNMQMPNGSTALHLAVKYQKTNLIKLLLDYNASTVIYDNQGLLPIHIACLNNDITTLRLLVRHRSSDINKANKYGLTPLHMVCKPDIDDDKNKKFQLAEILLERIDINLNCKTNLGVTPLHIAAAYNPAITKLLLNYGAIVDATTNTGETPLIYACKVKNNASNISLLLATGADINIKDSQLGWQPIHFACYTGNQPQVDLLLNHGADVNAKTPLFKGGVTPIILALKYQHNDLAEYLLAEKYADLNVSGTDDIVGCINKNSNDQSGILSTTFLILCCFPLIPIFTLCDLINGQEISCDRYAYAKNAIFPCLRPTAESFITDDSLLHRVNSTNNQRTITEEPSGELPHHKWQRF